MYNSPCQFETRRACAEISSFSKRENEGRYRLPQHFLVVSSYQLKKYNQSNDTHLLMVSPLLIPYNLFKSFLPHPCKKKLLS